ncbi:hypothetical protein N657DRAFT_638947 [Parathielavia appendiculata]|uniref:Uncharacterized protein n=1 Tax=Parathielavia appendiculata TaxID=2587402 RepID=A0AAN6U8L9_9PEZI|nr:hypothetical protein N657DRAFT_638947 [Parathielavia appendiculata]
MAVGSGGVPLLWVESAPFHIVLSATLGKVSAAGWGQSSLPVFRCGPATQVTHTPHWCRLMSGDILRCLGMFGRPPRLRARVVGELRISQARQVALCHWVANCSLRIARAACMVGKW